MELLHLPGLIDCHVHFREPGLTHKEDFESGARAALAGGIETVCDMPNTVPATCTVQALQDKIHIAERLRGFRSQVSGFRFDIRFFFGITRQEHLKELEKVMRNDALRKYVPGVKLYLGHSTGNQKAEAEIVEETFKFCAEKGMVVVCHCEDEEVIRRNKGDIRFQVSDIKSHSEIRSIEAAVKAVTQAIDLSRKHNTRLHIAHLSSADELELVRAAKKSGMPVTCEVAPHHLFLNIEDYQTLGTLAKMNPPLRTKDHCAALFEGILDGTVDCVASDHAPHTLEEKQTKNPLDAPSGVPGVETMLPLLLSCVFGDGPIDAQGKSRCQVSGFRFQVSDIVRLLYEAPNRIFHLGKPPFDPGKPEGRILVNPLENWVIRSKDLHSKCGWTPYEGWSVIGKVH